MISTDMQVMARVVIAAVLSLWLTTSAWAEDLTYCNQGLGALNAGNFDVAIEYVTRCLDYGELTSSNQANAFIHRGLSYRQKGNYDRAIRDFDQAIQLDPNSANAFNIRGIAYNEKDNIDRAIRDYDQAIRLKPDFAYAFYNRGVANFNKGDYDRAIRDFDQAIQLKPDFAAAFDKKAWALNGKAWKLATSNNADERDGLEAVRVAQEAISLNDVPNSRDTLAAAYSESGKFDSAVAEQERAIEMLKAEGKYDEVADYQTRLNLYRNGQPYRD